MTQVSSSFDLERQALLRSMNAVLAARRVIVAVAFGAALLIVVLSFLRPRVYTSSISIQPQTRRVDGILSGLGAQLGVRLPGSDGAQPLAFYADLARSPTILGPIVEQVFVDPSGRPKTLIDYYNVKGTRPEVRRYRAVQKLLDDLHATVRTRTGVVLIEVTLTDAHLALLTVQRVIAELDTYNLKTRQSEARLERRFSEGRVSEARQELRDAEDKMRQFLAANHGPRIAPDLKFEEDGLVREINVRQQVYTTLMQLYEQARLEEVRDTPVLSVVEPAVEAPNPDSRAIPLKAVIAFAVGLGLSLAFVLVKSGLTLEWEADPASHFRSLRAETLADLRRLRVPLSLYRRRR